MRFTASSGFAAPCTDAPLGINSPQSRQTPRPGLATRTKRRIGAPITIAGAFFVSAVSCNGGCAWETFGSAGFLFLGSPTCVQLPPNRLATIDVVFQLKRISCMLIAIPYRILASALRRLSPTPVSRSHRFFPIHSQSTRELRQVSHD